MLVLIKDEVSDWLHIWMAASSLNVKGNKAIIKNVVLANQSKYGHTYNFMLLMHLQLPTSLVYALPIFCNSKFVTVFRKTNWSARQLIIAYARKYAFKQEDANVNKEKEAHFTRRRSVGLASNLDGGIFPRRKR